MACFHSRYSLGDKIKESDPNEFLIQLVRETLSEAEIFQAVVSGKCPGIRIAQNNTAPHLADIYVTSYIRTVIGDSEPSEELEYEGVDPQAAAYSLEEMLTINHCLTLLSNHFAFLPLWLYDHSGITISCGARVGQYADRWDSSQVGWIFVKKEDLLKEQIATEENWREKADDIMRADVELYDQYLTGEVFGYTLYEAELPEDPEGTPDWEETDSCWGFYGNDLFTNGIADEVAIKDILASENYEESEAVLHVSCSY